MKRRVIDMKTIRNNKVEAALLALAMTFTAVLSGCGSQPEAKNDVTTVSD